MLSRAEFLRYFRDNHSSGQHVTFLAPTQRGKTTICHQMLGEVISPQLKATVFAGKPAKRDPVMNRAADRLRLRKVSEWPPDPYEQLRARKMNGYLLRPPHADEPEATEAIHRREFKAALTSNYASDKPNIVVVDEAPLVSNELKLRKHMDQILTRGAPVVSLWSLAQRGRFLSYLIYDQPEWILIGFDADTSNQRRYADIGGVDPRAVVALQTNLQTRDTKTGGTISQFLVIRRSGPRMFIVDLD